MRRILLSLLLLAPVFGGACASTAANVAVALPLLGFPATRMPPEAVHAAIPKFMGTESSSDLLAGDAAHNWTDDDARTALWYTRNFPDDLAALGFSLHKIFSYNRRDDNLGRPIDERMGRRDWSTTSRSVGHPYGGIFHTEMDEVIALLQDPQLRVKMLSLQAKDRNRLRERNRRRRTGEWPFTTDVQGEQPPRKLDDAEVEQRLMEMYR